MAEHYLRMDPSSDVPYWTTSTSGGDRFFMIDITTDTPRWVAIGDIGPNDRFFVMESTTDVPKWDG